MGVRWSRMSWSDRNELWARWRRGESVRQIALGLRRASSVIHTVVAAEGGITPRPRRRSRLALVRLSAKKFPGTWRAATRYERSVKCSAERRPR
jgi:hypothetical protein